MPALGGAATGDAGVGAGVRCTVWRPTANGTEAARSGAVRMAGARRVDVAAGIAVATGGRTADGRGAVALPGAVVGAIVTTDARTVEALPTRTATRALRARITDHTARPPAAALGFPAQGAGLLRESSEQARPRKRGPEDGQSLTPGNPRGKRAGEPIKAVSVHEHSPPVHENHENPASRNGSAGFASRSSRHHGDHLGGRNHRVYSELTLCFESALIRRCLLTG